MATLKVTFGRVSVSPQLEDGLLARTQEITLTSQTAVGALTANSKENVATLYSSVDCWVAMGERPDPATAPTRRFLPATVEKQFAIIAGTKVAAKTA